MPGDESGIEINDNDNIGMFWSKNKKQTPQIVDDESNNEYVLEKTGDDFEEQEYEEVPTEREEIDEIIPEGPIKKERTKKDSQESKDNSPKFSVTAKIDPEDKELLADIEDRYGISTSQALIKCIECYREIHGEETKSIAKKIRRLRNKQ